MRNLHGGLWDRKVCYNWGYWNWVNNVANGAKASARDRPSVERKNTSSRYCISLIRNWIGNRENRCFCWCLTKWGYCKRKICCRYIWIGRIGKQCVRYGHVIDANIGRSGRRFDWYYACRCDAQKRWSNECRVGCVWVNAVRVRTVSLTALGISNYKSKGRCGYWERVAIIYRFVRQGGACNCESLLHATALSADGSD